MSPKYDLHKLGWKAFQDLCLTILREILGQTVEASLDTHDGGQDGAFSGIWHAQDGEDLTGHFVAQCKHTSQAGRNLRPSDLTSELSKVEKLVARGRCDTYLLMTNAGLSFPTRAKLTEDLQDAGVKYIRYFDTTWINSLIHENSRLRMHVPRLYGLGDLSQILDARAYAQARAILASMREDLSKVVLTGTYRKALAALEEHRFVLLVGEPAAGKTTIASMLAMAAIDGNDASPLKLDHPKSLADHWNPDEPSQLFWLDDAFGVTQYEHDRVLAWNHVLPRLRPMLRSGATIVMTSRDYIYNRARGSLKESAFPLLRESQVVVDVRDLELPEKRQILYNHLKLGGQPRAFLSRLKPHLEGVARNARFIPETARRLADPLFTKGLTIGRSSIERFVEQQESFLRDVVRGLDADSQAALALIYLRGGRLQSPVDLRSREEQVLQRLGSQLGGCIAALRAMDKSLVLRTDAGAAAFWQFKHPTIGDAYAADLAASSEHMTIFIEGGDPERLVYQVTCGEVGIKNAVVLTRDMFSQMAEKLESIQPGATWQERYDKKERMMSFLSYRCSKEFLSFYFRRNPALFQAVSKPGLSLGAMGEVRLATRLHAFGLLPEQHRQRFVHTVSEYAVRGLDLYALGNSDIRALFTDDELTDLTRRLRSDLLPQLDDVRAGWESEYEPGESAQDLMSERLEELDSLKELLADDREAGSEIEYQKSAIQEWVDEHPEVGWEPAHRRHQLPDLLDVDGSKRSIFDDIDAEDALKK